MEVYGCPSWDNAVMAILLGNHGILEQGGGHMAVHSRIARLLGNPGRLGQRGAYGCPFWDNPGCGIIVPSTSTLVRVVAC